MTSSAAPSRPLWLIAAPALFLILWSAGFAIAKLGLQHAPPITLLALRYCLVLLLLLPVALVIRPAWPKGLRAWGDVAVVGFLIQVAYFGLCYMAFKSVVVILSRGEIEAANLSGLVLTCLALLGMTAGTLYEKRFGVSHHPVASNLIQYAVGAGFTLPLALMTETIAIRWDAEFIAVLAYLVVGNSLLAMSLLLAMIRVGEVSRVSALFYLVPAMAALFAVPLLGETMPPMAWAGMALAGLGVAMASRR